MARIALPAPYWIQASLEAATPEEPPKKVATPSQSSWTAIGTWFLLTVYAALNHGYQEFWPLLRDLLTGHANATQLHTGLLLHMAPIIAAMVSIALVLVVPVGVIVSTMVKFTPEQHKGTEMFVARKPKYQFMETMLGLTSEELIARWLFIGMGSKLHALDNALGFYLLFFMGNLAWALLHVANLKDVKLSVYQKFIFVLPQFIGGVLFTAVYVPFGLLGAFLAHVVYDVILFSMDRRGRFNLGERLVIGYHAAIAMLAACFFIPDGHDIRDIKAWFINNTTSFALPGWGFRDYVCATLLVVSITTIAAELLHYDREGGATFGEAIRDWWHYSEFLAFGFVLLTATQGLTTHTPFPLVARISVLSIVGAFVIKSASGSGVARIFWECLLITSMAIGAMYALGVTRGTWLLLIIMVALLPDRIIRYYDVDNRPVREQAKRLAELENEPAAS